MNATEVATVVDVHHLGIVRGLRACRRGMHPLLVREVGMRMEKRLIHCTKVRFEYL
jgi:hypothetical protein